MATALSVGNEVLAVTCTTTNTSSNWSQQTTWGAAGTGCVGATGGIPGSVDDVVISNQTRTYVVDQAFTVSSVTFNTGNRNTTVQVGAGQTLSVSGNVVIQSASNNTTKLLDVLAGATLSVGGNVTITGTGTQVARLNLTSGAATTVTITGNLTPSANTSAQVVFGGAGTLNIGGTYTSNASTFTAGTGTVNYNGTGAQTIPTYAYNNLSVTKSSGTATLNANTTVGGNLSVTCPVTCTNGTLSLATFTANRTVAGGSITVGPGATLSIGATGGTNGFPTNYTTHTLDATSTVNYAGAAQTVSAESYGHLTLSGSGVKTMTSVTTVNGNLTLSGTATATTAANFSVGGNVDVGTGTSLTAGAFDFIVTGTTGITGTLVHSSSTGTKRHTGLATVNAGGVWNNSGNAAVNFRGGITHNGTTFTAGSGVQTFDTNSQAVGGTSSLSIPSVTVTGVTLTNNGTLTVATALSGTGGMTNAASAALNVGGTSGITTLTAAASPNTVTFNGSATQTVNAATYHHLTLNNASGGTLGGDATVNGTLTFTITSGTLTTGSANTLTLASGASTSGAATSRHVVGNLRRVFAASTTFTYDIGDGTNYTPLLVVFTAAVTGNLTATVTGEDHRNSTAGTSGVDAAKSVNRYWSLKNSTVAGTYAPTWTYVAGDNDAATPANYRIRRGARCSGSLESRTCTPWSSLTVSGTPTNVNAAATGVAITADDPAEADFAIGEPDTSTNFLREKQFIYTREVY